MKCACQFFMLLMFLVLPPSVFSQSKCATVRDIDLKNLIYPLDEKEVTPDKWKLKLINGVFEEPHDNPPSVGYLYMRITDIVYGDLTGDGKDEAAVVTVYGSASANFFQTDTYIWSCTKNRHSLTAILWTFFGVEVK